MNKIVKVAAAAAIVLATATPAFASYHKTVVITKTHIENDARVKNTVTTTAKTGGNNLTVNDGDTHGGNTTSGDANGKFGDSGNAKGGSTTGGNAGWLTTGNADASSEVTNVVNTTSVSFE